MEDKMLNWLKKTGAELNTMAKNAVNTPAPIGKTILITGGILLVGFAVTHKMKVIVVFG
jgi:hypothetical protein